MEKQLNCFVSNNIKDIYIITGYAGHTIYNAFGDNYKNKASIKYIFNNRWDTTNNIYSLYLAKEVAKGGFLLINSDDLLHPEILRNIIEDEASEAICVDDYKRLGEEEMKVLLQKGRLKEINKTMEPSKASGEFIGVAKFGEVGARELFTVIQEFVQNDDLDGWYEEAFNKICNRITIKAVSTNGLPWIEIDTPEDIHEARKRIWPAIRIMTRNR